MNKFSASNSNIQRPNKPVYHLNSVSHVKYKHGIIAENKTQHLRSHCWKTERIPRVPQYSLAGSVYNFAVSMSQWQENNSFGPNDVRSKLTVDIQLPRELTHA
jgi:hypothetical protein